jgi:hypothetical protein
MDFLARVKAVRADVGRQELTLVFSVRLDEESLDAAQELAQFLDKDAGDVEIKISPRQIPLLPKLSVKHEAAVQTEG